MCGVVGGAWRGFDGVSCVIGVSRDASLCVCVCVPVWSGDVIVVVVVVCTCMCTHGAIEVSRAIAPVILVVHEGI